MDGNVEEFSNYLSRQEDEIEKLEIEQRKLVDDKDKLQSILNKKASHVNRLKREENDILTEILILESKKCAMQNKIISIKGNKWELQDERGKIIEKLSQKHEKKREILDEKESYDEEKNKLKYSKIDIENELREIQTKLNEKQREYETTLIEKTSFAFEIRNIETYIKSIKLDIEKLHKNIHEDERKENERLADIKGKLDAVEESLMFTSVLIKENEIENIDLKMKKQIILDEIEVKSFFSVVILCD